MQYRRLASLVLGAWLGAAIFADFAVTQNFQTVDRFLQKPGSAVTSDQLNQIGRPREREILRRNAGEENNYLFENWERFELAIGSILFFVLLFGSRPHKFMLAMSLVLILIVAVQHFFLSPLVADLGRKMADLPGDAALNTRFWTLHGLYSGAEILKLVAGFVLAGRLSVRRRTDPDRFVKEYETEVAGRRKM